MDWHGLSVLYVCPLRALLNNLEVRLSHYCGLVGRRVGIWHGDIGDSARQRIFTDPPDCLLITPESLEVILVSRRWDRKRLFPTVRAVVVDELHAFAGDDRGWHLLAVLERITRIAGREIQRLGLSATIGNPEELIEWLAGGCTAPRRVIAPPAPSASDTEVKVDFVGTLENAARVIAGPPRMRCASCRFRPRPPARPRGTRAGGRRSRRVNRAARHQDDPTARATRVLLARPRSSRPSS